MHDQPVSLIMKTSAVTVEVSASYEDARRALCDTATHLVPVLSGTRLIGVLTARDLLLPEVRSVADAMRVSLHVLHEDATVREALKLMVHSELTQIPVVNAAHDYMGIVSAVDLIKELPLEDVSAAPAKEETLVEIRSSDIQQLSEEDYRHALITAYRLYTAGEVSRIGQALLYADRHNLLLEKVFNIARRYLFAGQSLQEMSLLQRAIEEVRDFEEKTGHSRRIPTGRM